jgi:hypothetical protein
VRFSASTWYQIPLSFLNASSPAIVLAVTGERFVMWNTTRPMLKFRHERSMCKKWSWSNDPRPASVRLARFSARTPLFGVTCSCTTRASMAAVSMRRMRIRSVGMAGLSVRMAARVCEGARAEAHGGQRRGFASHKGEQRKERILCFV